MIDQFNGFDDEDGYIFNQRISYAKKKAHDFRWAEQSADYIDRVYNCYGDKKKQANLQMNYDLYNGLGENAMQSYVTDNYDVLLAEGISTGYENVQHHPVIDQVAKAMVGEQELRPFNPVAYDSSKYTMNQRKRKKLELLQAHIQETIIAPIHQQAQMQWMQENNVTDPYNLNPQQQRQMQNEVGQRAQAMTPKEIQEYMRTDYKSPSEIQAQKLMDFLTHELDLKYRTDEGFKHGIITGEEIYRVGIRHNFPFVEQVNSLGFFHLARPNSRFIEEGVAWKYEQYVMYNDIYAWHGDEIGQSRTIKEKLNSYSRGVVDNRPGASNPRLVAEVQNNPAIIDASPDIRSKEGQEYLAGIFNSMGANVNRGGDIRYTHIAWKALRKLKQIKRYHRESDAVKSDWIDESYTFNPIRDKEGWQDIEEFQAWVPEVWETTKVGYTDGVYFQKRPIPYQYKSIEDPWDVKGPYIGAQYNKLMGNTKNTAPMDPAKPWQYKFNVQMAKIHELEATDIGKVLLTSFHAKPKDWSWQKYLMMAKYGKMIPVDLQQEGVTPMDAQIFKSLDLSTVKDIADKLQYLEFIRNQIALSMSYNPSRLGMQSPTVSVTNNQQNIVQSSYQTNSIYNIHNKICENLCNALLNVTRVAFKDNDLLRTYVLDDMSIAELELDWEMLDRSVLGIKMRNNSEDFQNIIQLKQLMQPMVQNGLISLPELIKLQWAKSGAEIQNIAENAEEKMQKRRQEEQQAQQQMMEQQAQMQQQLQEQQQQYDMLKLQVELESEERRSIIESTRFAQQKDIDQNKINDDLQKVAAEHEYKLIQLDLQHKQKLLEISLKNKELDSKAKLEQSKLKKEIEFKEKELKIKEKELAIKKIAANKPSPSTGAK